MNKGLSIDNATGDLLVDYRNTVIGRAATTIAALITTTNRGELKEMPLIGGEAAMQMGGCRQQLWLTRLRKQLTAVGLTVNQLQIVDGTINISVE